MGPNQTYKLLHSKGNHQQNEKTTYGLRENICDQQGLNFQNIQTVHTNSITKKQTTQSKNGQKT